MVGESFLVKVDFRKECSDKQVRITINGVDGAEQYLQLIGRPGQRDIFVMATTVEGPIEQKRVTICVKDLHDANPFPVIQSTESRYTPRAAVFRIGNSNDANMSSTSYDWDFGDGTFGHSEGASAVEHDYTASLLRDELTTTFHLTVTAHFPDNSHRTVNRTVSIFNLYAHNKLRSILSPRAQLRPILWWDNLFPLNDTTWTIDITNLEDETIFFTEQRIELLDTSPDSNPPISSPTTVNITINPHQTHSIPISMPKSTFKGTIYGFAAHFKGQGLMTRTLALSSMYIKVRNPRQLGGIITNPFLTGILDARFKGNPILSHADIQFILETQKAPPPNNLTVNVSQVARLPPKSGFTLSVPREIDCASGKPLDPTILPLFVDGGLNLNQNITANTQLNRRDTPVIGAECDPDNLPDNIPEGTTCQFTGVFAWQFVPGQILNAKKGDILLSPGGDGLIGQLLQNVNPPQYYSHSGIMTKNHIEVRHSTASRDWLLDHKAGSVLGNKGVDGFEPNALRYLWPGTITQTIDHATYGEFLTSPEGKTYSIGPFTFYANRGDTNTLAVPVVVKPAPHLETPDVRKTLHQIADAAVGIHGHYRFYAYTRPQLALESSGIAPPGAGWAAGTVPTVCSSFIWLACQRAGVKLEGSNPIELVTELEAVDIASGARVGPDTLDGLYLYTATERQAAAHWLYDNIYQQVFSQAGFWGRLFTDAPDNVANQVVNTFASDFVDGDSKDSDNWKNTGDANAVSPQNIMFWDSPGPGNQNGFRSVYGYAEDLFYSPGNYENVPVYRWKQVPTKGDLGGTVVASDGGVDGATVSLLGSGKPDIVVGSDGQFSFNGVAEGDYTVKAGLNINGFFEQASQNIHIKAGSKTNVVLALNPPPEINRQVTISIHMEVTNVDIGGHHTRTFDFTKSTWVHPFHSHDGISFDAPFGGNSVHGVISFSVDLNPDLSINLSWTAQEIDDEVESQLGSSMVVGRDGTGSWRGLTVSNDDPIDADWTTMAWTVHNGQA